MSLTKDSLKAIMPKKLKSMVNDDLVDRLNKASIDPEMLDGFRDNFVSYLSVLTTGRYKLEDYLNAVKFVTYKLLEKGDLEAWIATFPERYQRLRDMGKSDDDIRPHAAMFKKGKLVVQIFEQTIIPSHVLNAPLHQNAINLLVTIMNDRREKGLVRVKAAEAVINATKQPEVKGLKIGIDMGVETMDAISDLKHASEKLANAQLEAIRQGVPLASIAASDIIEGEVVDIEPINEEEDSYQ